MSFTLENFKEGIKKRIGIYLQEEIEKNGISDADKLCGHLPTVELVNACLPKTIPHEYLIDIWSQEPKMHRIGVSYYNTQEMAAFGAIACIYEDISEWGRQYAEGAEYEVYLDVICELVGDSQIHARILGFQLDEHGVFYQAIIEGNGFDATTSPIDEDNGQLYLSLDLSVFDDTIRYNLSSKEVECYRKFKTDMDFGGDGHFVSIEELYGRVLAYKKNEQDLVEIFAKVEEKRKQVSCGDVDNTSELALCSGRQ